MLTVAIVLCTVMLVISVVDVLVTWNASNRIPITDKCWSSLFGGSIIKGRGIAAFALFRFLTVMGYCVAALWCIVIDPQAVLPMLVPLGMVNLLVTCYNQHICQRSVQ